jgi:hypothetical protein
MTREFLDVYENKVTMRLGGFAHFDALGALILSLPAARCNSSTATLGCAVFDQSNHLGGLKV